MQITRDGLQRPDQGGEVRRVDQPSSLPLLHPIRLKVGLLAGVGLLMAVAGFPAIFDRFNLYDDEGFYLLQLRYAVERRGPYTHIWSQYGPAYNSIVSLISWVTRIPLDHDGGRILTLILWATAAVLTGMFVLRATRSFTLGAATVVVGFLWLGTVTNEPNQPAPIGFILTLGILLLSQRRNPWQSRNALFIGALCMALVMVKANLGIYAIAAVIVAVVATVEVSRWLRNLVFVASVILPLAILVHGLSQLHVFLFAATVEVGVAALIIGARMIRQREANVGWRWFALGGLVALVVSLLGGVVEGDPLGTVIQAALIHPLGYTSEGSSYALNMAGTLGASLAACAAIVQLHFKDWRWLRLTLRALVLPAILVPVFLSMARGVNTPLAYAPIGWAAVPVLLLGVRELDRAEIRMRICLGAFVVFNELQAYPIAGSQVPYSTFLSVPAAFIIAGDLLQELRSERAGVPRRGLTNRLGWLTAAGIALAASAMLVQSSIQQWSTYSDNTSLDLAGSGLIRLPQDQAAVLEATVRDVQGRSCSSLITFPGMLSFYAWTDLSPPHGLIVGDSIGWQHLDQRRAVMEHLRQVTSGCLIGNPFVEYFWNSIGTLPKWPSFTPFLIKKFDVNSANHADGINVYIVSQSAD